MNEFLLNCIRSIKQQPVPDARVEQPQLFTAVISRSLHHTNLVSRFDLTDVWLWQQSQHRFWRTNKSGVEPNLIQLKH